jgi:hypothetical protein
MISSDYELVDDELTHEGCISIPYPPYGYGWDRFFYDPAEKRFLHDVYSTGIIADDETRYHGTEDLTLEEIKASIPCKWPPNHAGVKVLNEILARDFPEEEPVKDPD